MYHDAARILNGLRPAASFFNRDSGFGNSGLPRVSRTFVCGKKNEPRELVGHFLFRGSEPRRLGFLFICVLCFLLFFSFERKSRVSLRQNEPLFASEIAVRLRG